MGPGMTGQMGPGMMGPAMMRMMLVLMDTDGDGTVSLSEFQAAHERIFKALDANKDGRLTLQEVQAFFQGQNEMKAPDRTPSQRDSSPPETRPARRQPCAIALAACPTRPFRYGGPSPSTARSELRYDWPRWRRIAGANVMAKEKHLERDQGTMVEAAKAGVAVAKLAATAGLAAAGPAAAGVVLESVSKRSTECRAKGGERDGRGASEAFGEREASTQEDDRGESLLEVRRNERQETRRRRGERLLQSRRSER